MKNSEARRYAQFCRHGRRFGLSVAEYRAKRERGEIYCSCCRETPLQGVGGLGKQIQWLHQRVKSTEGDSP